MNSPQCRYSDRPPTIFPRILALGLFGAFLTFSASCVRAFSLLGPYAVWMDEAKSLQPDRHIGGPMNIGEEYRWNVPVVTIQ